MKFSAEKYQGKKKQKTKGPSIDSGQVKIIGLAFPDELAKSLYRVNLCLMTCDQ